MLEQLDLSLKVEKDVYKEQKPRLQDRLYAMERSLIAARIPALILFEGWAGTAKISTISLLVRQLDPRGIRVHPITPPRTYEQQYPWLYRFWLKTPSYGQIGLFDRSWYRQAIAERTHGNRSQETWRNQLEDIVQFERQLADDGALILKFWFHISKKEQEKRFHKLLSDPLTSWQVSDEDRWQHEHYQRVYDAAEDMLARTDAPHAPWLPIAATDKRYMRLRVFEAILAATEARLGAVESLDQTQQDDQFDVPRSALRVASVLQAAPPTDTDTPATSAGGVLSRINLATPPVKREDYDTELTRLQMQMRMLGLEVYKQQRPVVLVFEGWDAAGKGGAIQRLTAHIDPRGYVVHAIAAPSGEDREHHYLYRFWRRLPTRGTIGVFDRSWYGRVLVERVEGFATVPEWQRAYVEINEFERQLTNFGTIICKFWVHISPEEQLRRFESRQQVPHKAWKLTDEDWRNREKWPQYEAAADEMLTRTSTPAAPWTVVEGEDKLFARLKVLRTVVQRLESELGRVKLP